MAMPEEPANIDDLGFNAVTNDRLFSQGFQIQNSGSYSFDNQNTAQFESMVDIEVLDNSSDTQAGAGYLNPNFVSDDENLDFIAMSYKQSSNQQSQGLKIKRLTTSWLTKSGKLTVGSDWTNFQDLLSIDKEIKSINSAVEGRSVASQIKWLSPNGFSISLEDSPTTSIYDNSLADDIEAGSSPNLILSWKGGPGGGAGEYRVTAMGKKLDAVSSGQSFSGSDVIGWGLNLEGGWQIGDLFAALSVTFGKGINSYILQRYGNDLIVTPNHLDNTTDSLSIKPSLYYSLNKNSNFHVSLGHFTSDESFDESGIDTLDTVHMGYTWSPWPSTKFGLELVGKNADGRNGITEETTELKFGAQKLF